MTIRTEIAKAGRAYRDAAMLLDQATAAIIKAKNLSLHAGHSIDAHRAIDDRLEMNDAWNMRNRASDLEHLLATLPGKIFETEYERCQSCRHFCRDETKHAIGDGAYHVDSSECRADDVFNCPAVHSAGFGVER